MIFLPRHFTPRELMDKATWEKFGLEGVRYFRPEILVALDWIWENYPTNGERAILVNAWSFGGTTQYRGLRFPSSPEYRTHSAHSFGAAVDISPAGISCEGLRAWIRLEHKKALEQVATWKAGRAVYQEPPILHVRRMEIGTVTWVHIDCLEHPGENLLMVNP